MINKLLILNITFWAIIFVFPSISFCYSNIKWEQTFSHKITTIQISNRDLFISTNKFLLLEYITGKTKWEFRSCSDFKYCRNIIVLRDGRKLYGIDLFDKTTLWETPEYITLGGYFIHNNIIYISSRKSNDN